MKIKIKKDRPVRFSVKGIFSLLCVIFFCSRLMGQSYTSWILGDTIDVVTNDRQPGVVLAGGGKDDAMRWMLQRADGGDVVVIRASGEDLYNKYFFQI